MLQDNVVAWVFLLGCFGLVLGWVGFFQDFCLFGVFFVGFCLFVLKNLIISFSSPEAQDFQQQDLEETRCGQAFTGIHTSEVSNAMHIPPRRWVSVL